MLFYKLLLRLYPASFRVEYGAEMCKIFARRRNETGGIFAWLVLWADTLPEVFGNAAAAHWDILRQDLLYTLRTLRRAPGFTATAIVVVALGVGANTAVFSVIDQVLIRPLPFREPSRLVKLWEIRAGYPQMEPSSANYRDWVRMSTVFENTGAFYGEAANLSGYGDPERLRGASLTAGVLPTLGAEAMLGRTFSAEDDRPGAPATIILSYPLWQAVFGADQSIIGRKILMNDAPAIVIGVMPREFSFPSRDAQFWLPMQLKEENFQDRNDNVLEVIARLKPGVTLEAARSEMKVIASRLEQQYPKENKNAGATAIDLRDELSSQSRVLLTALMAAAVCVLLIACANLANLLLARAIARRKELSVRTALGAGRERLMRQMLTESLVLAAVGGGLGVIVAMAAVPLLARMVPNVLPFAEQPSVDLRVLGFAAALTLVTGICFGAIPALRIGRDAGFAGLHEGRGGSGQKARLRSALVIAEVAVSMVLLISAGLLMRALWNVQGRNPGFRTDDVLTLRTPLPQPKYEKTARRGAFYDRVLGEIRALPGVTNAAYISFLPMVFRGGIFPVGIGAETLDRTANHVASMRYVTPGFFTTMGIPLHAGRDVAASDASDRAFVAVVSESLAQKYWPGESPLGRHFQFAFHDRTVIGVVGDIRVRGMEQNSEPQVYLPYMQQPDASFAFYAPKDLVVHAASPAALLPSIRRIVLNADTQLPVTDVRMLNDIVDTQTASRTLQLRVIGIFAAVAFLLAAIGIHGVLAFAVSQRTQEIGVRIALGARRGHILSMVLRQGVLLAVAGVLPGLALAYAAGTTMRALLVGVQPGDIATFAAASALSAAMTVAGSLVPAMRAVRVDPMQAMRNE